MLSPKQITKRLILTVYDGLSHLKYGGQKYIFLHSHMRARSTLLTSILCSSHEISGDHEYHQSYNDFSGLDFLRWKILRMNTRWKPFPKYVLDHINQSTFKVAPPLFEKSNIFHIFLLRPPLNTIQSCLTKWKDTRSLDYFLKYYNYRVEELVELSKLASKSPNGYIYINSDELVENPEKNLDKISKYLALCEPLSVEYKRETPWIDNAAPDHEIFPSQGKIVKKKYNYTTVIPQEKIEPAWLTYKKAHKELKIK